MNHTRTSVYIWVVAALVPLLCVGTLCAQLTLGSISIEITDKSGALLPGCEIRVENVETGAIRQTQSDTSGISTVTALPSGHYRLVASKAGFSNAATEVSVGVGQTVTANIQLALGAVSETVNVVASAAELALQKEDHVISQLVSDTQIASLPMN